MATSKEKWDEVFQVLSEFERQTLDSSDFNWKFLVERTGVSKPTLWRNKEFRSEHERIGKLVQKYREGKAQYDLEKSQLSKKDQEIKDLKERIASLEKALDHERERLAYASLVARQNDLDPRKFCEESPLIAVKSNAKKEANSKKAPLDLDRFRKSQ